MTWPELTEQERKVIALGDALDEAIWDAASIRPREDAVAHIRKALEALTVGAVDLRLEWRAAEIAPRETP